MSEVPLSPATVALAMIDMYRGYSKVRTHTILRVILRLDLVQCCQLPGKVDSWTFSHLGCFKMCRVQCVLFDPVPKSGQTDDGQKRGYQIACGQNRHTKKIDHGPNLGYEPLRKRANFV